MNDLNGILIFLQENWQWMFALVCLALYFKGKSEKSNKPSNKLEEIGQKAEALLEEKAEDFVEKVEEEALEALEQKIDELDDQAMQVIKEVIEIASEVKSKSEWTKPVLAHYDMSLEGQEALFQSELNEFMEKLKDAGYEFSPMGGYPDPSRVSKARTCPCGSGISYKKCHASQWVPDPE